MHLIFFLIAIVLAFAGMLLISFAVPVVDVAAAALFISGIVAIVGGFILAALAAAVRSLSSIAERIAMQPLPVPPVASVGHEDPGPRAVRPPKPAVPEGPKRSSLLSWFGRASSAVTERPQLAGDAPPASSAAAEQVDLAPLARVAEEPRPAPAVAAPPPPPPKPAAPALRAPSKAPPAPSSPPPAPPVVAPPAAAPAATPAPVAPPHTETPESTVYKSGVIDGMAYTLYMDGAIEAELPQGRVRFESVEQLQTYLVSRQQQS